MLGFMANCRVGALVAVFLLVGLTGLYELLKPVPSGCMMTYMYPTYIPISTPSNVSSDKYGLFLYHEGWKKIDFAEHIKKLDGVPVLFIPGNGGSYKQARCRNPFSFCVRSLAAESSRAYQGGPLEPTFYQEASFLQVVGEHNVLSEDLDAFNYPTKYTRMLDWFAVDLEGEHSALDGRILEEHAHYVVYSIHRILDLYQHSHEARLKQGADVAGSVPSSVILVGHSMGGFVARAAVVHPHLRNSAVETILTLSSPHQAPPVALQPSLGCYFSQVNDEWKKRFMMQSNLPDHVPSRKELFHVVVISISGGINDCQIRSKLASLDGIVPSTHGFMIASSSMKNVWLSMEHQTILWCNQFVVQMSHTLLTLINPATGEPFSNPQKRLLVFTRMLQTGLPQSLGWLKPMQSSWALQNVPFNDVKDGLQMNAFSSCPPLFHWAQDVLEKDLYIQSTTVTVLAMDGRRRWLDIKSLGLNGEGHFVFVTNLAPCSGVRLHLWPEKGQSLLGDELPLGKRVLEVTSKMVQIPAGPAPRQIEPGSQSEQAAPSALLVLKPEEMHGYRFLTISVGPRPTVSGRPPPATSMAVGQFFNPKNGEKEFSPILLLHTVLVKEEMFLKEDHPLALNLSFAVSLGVWPVTLSLRTEGCGLKDSAGHMDQSSLCRLRCFPPVAIAWNSVSGLHVIPNVYSETVVVDSSAAIIGFMVTVVLFALMRQAHAWELDLHVPSVLATVELNLRIPRAFLLLVALPIFTSLLLSLLTTHGPPPLIVQILRSNPSLVVASLTIPLVCFVHPALGLIVLLLHHAFQCHTTLCSFSQRREFTDPKTLSSSSPASKSKSNDALKSVLSLEDAPNSDPSSSPNSAKSFGQSQLETFNCKHGMLILHLLATLMFIPSLSAWLQRIGMGQSFPWFIDSSLCIGVILHGLAGSLRENYFLSIRLPGIRHCEFRQSIMYLVAGYYSFFCALTSAPYKTFYAIAIIGVCSFCLTILYRRYQDVGNNHYRNNRKHSHKH
ncbi:hypothetical protein AXF42_Ash018749 [Apostasia shenzhenica]|uniref:GPI inositol-deacylase n=1 Tax=Apostasia shenzhenica TaxID=1088818 RepID=A0A2I0AJV0_9ASPA|nr:hypothetical protein AXF42_Ash018749 [Apostasia shenzhenica]